MRKPFLVSVIVGLLMASSGALTLAMTPSVQIARQNQLDLEALIPTKFKDWEADSSNAPLLINPEVKGALDRIYTQTLSRTYINRQGDRVMLSIAYGDDQRTDLQVHRPEVCYLADGFDISAMTKTFVDTTIGRIPVMHLVAKQGARNEPISYWIRVGDSVTRGWFEQKWTSFIYGLTGKIPDGLLFRISTISNDEQDSYRIQQAFLTDLLQAVRSEDRYWLVGRLGT